MPILDTNVILRHLLQDSIEHSPRATAFMARLQRGEVRVEMPATVVFEAVYILEGFYRQRRDTVRNLVAPLLQWRNISISERDALRRAFDFYVEHNLSFADCYHAALAEKADPPQIVSFDRGFNRIRTIERIEP